MWSIFEQSAVEDETISNTFSSRGIFKISSDDEAKEYPMVHASVQNLKMAISIDKSITLLEDEMVAKCSSLSFNSDIDVITISNSGNLIVCGLRDGEIHGVFIKGILLFNVCIKVEDVHLTDKTFSNLQQLDNRFYFTCTNGSVYCLSEIDEKALESNPLLNVNENESIAHDKNILDDVIIQRKSTGRAMGEINTALLLKAYSSGLNIDENKMLITGSHCTVNFRTDSDDLTRITLPDHFSGLKNLYNLEHFVLALTNSGHLLEICPFTRSVSLCGPFCVGESVLIEDMLVMENNDENIELLLLTKPIDRERFIKIVEYPSFKCNNELDVSEHSWLVRQSKSAVNLYYLTGKNMNNANIPTEVEMVLVSETEPSERFKKLIAKGHLKEAEEFGKQFELCLQPIFEAKAKRILIELSNSKESNSASMEPLFEKLKELISEIESSEFFKKHRMINLPSRQIFERYLREILPRFDSTVDYVDISEINEQLQRLKTLKIIDPYECDMEWQKFVYHPNLVKMIKSLFQSDIPKASLIWRRHSYNMAPHLNEEELRRLLKLFPSDTEAFNVVLWLRQFVPTVINTHPGIMPFITEWSIQKTRSLQYADHWPEIGLEFSTKIMEIFEDIEIIYTDVRRKHDQNINKLRVLVNQLQELSVLKKSYNMIFSLDTYMQDSMDETALCILQRVHLDKLKGLVNDFLYPIYQEKGNTPVNAIKNYISKLVANRNSVSNWLQRAVSCIELLHNVDDRLESALSVLQNSPVPWPDTVAPLIKLRASSHPLALKISAEYELQVIKIMTVKYGWPADSTSNINLQLLMMRIVKLNFPDMIDDIRILTKAAPEISTSANFNCCYQMARRGQIDLAYKFFKSLRSDKGLKVATDIVNILADLLRNATATLSLQDSKACEEHNHLLEFFKLAMKHADFDAEKQYFTIKNSFVLRIKFNLKVRSDYEISCIEERMSLLEAGLERIIERSQSTVNVYMFIGSEVGELCTALNIEKVVGLYKICKRINCLPLTAALAYYVNGFIDCTPENTEDFIKFAIELIVQQITIAKRNRSSSTMQLLKEYDPLSFPLVFELLTSVMLHERKRQRDLYELIKCVHIANAHYALNDVELHYGNNRQKKINEQICQTLEGCDIAFGETTLNFSTALNGSLMDVKQAPTKKRDSVSVFEDVEVQVQASIRTRVNGHLHIAKFVARTLLLMVVESEPMNSLFLQLKNALPNDIILDVDGAREDFFLSLEKLIKAKEYDTWYTMSQHLLEYQKQNKCKRIINADFVALQLSRLFRNAMMHQDVNFHDMYVKLISNSHAMSVLDRLSNDIKSDQQKMNFLILSEMFNMYLGETEKVEAIRVNRIKHFYYMEFCKQDPSIKGKFNADIDNIEQLLKEFHNKQLNVNLLERMSRDFNFDYQKMLITQIMSILSSQQMQYEVKTDAFGNEELVMLSSVKEMRDMCQQYIDEVNNIELLTAKLKNFIDEINIYFYEQYLCVIEILLFIGGAPKEMEIWTNVLHFLKHKMTTRRCNRPGQLETDTWLQCQKEIGILPKIARYRLPFKPIVEQPLKDILDSELNVDNCHSWFPLIQMHSVLKGSTSKDIAQNCDYFCMSAVKNSIAEYKNNKNELETWNLHPTNNAFLKSILRLVKHVHNPCKAFLILYFVSNYAPDGADQVEAAYECWKYAIENESIINDPKCQVQLTKIKRKYPILKTQHLLYVYGLTDEKLMRLVESPTELIHSLYHHEIILKGSKFDVNGVVKEIAKLHELNLENIQYKLLHKWLSFSIEPVDGTVLEETFFEEQNVTLQASEDIGKATDNVMRANYVLSSWPKEEAVQYLISHILNPEGGVNTSEQLQMFECISNLDDDGTSFNELISQRQYITIKCVHDLKALGYNSSVEKFGDSSFNKIDLLKLIWQRNSQNAFTLEVMANICLGFDIYIPQIWNGILKRMVMFNMIKKLNALVDMLSCKPELLQTEGLAMAWDCVLQHPLKNADQARSFSQEEQLHKTLLRLQTCPVAHALNLYQFAEQCVVIERSHMAAIVLSFCQSTKELQKIKKLILTRSTNKLRKEILELEDVGILPMILNFALKELNL